MFGGEGSGPSEHRSITELAVGPGDSVYVFDSRQSRFNVWTPAGTFGRVGRLPGFPHEAFVLPDGRLLLQAWIRTPAHAGLPLHLLDREGEIVLSFGSEKGAFRPGNPLQRFRAVALTDDRAVWSGRYDRYELERWSLNGELQKRLVRDVHWFPPRDGEATPPQPTLRALTYDSAGLLWVLINVPDPNWDGTVPADRGPSIERDHRMFDTVIEVIDVRTGTLVLSRRHPLAFFRFIAPGLVPIGRERADGSRYIEIWTVDMTRS